MTSSSRASTHRTIALLADRFDEPYQQTILSAMEDAAQQRGASLLAFAGGIPGSTRRGSERRALMFELVSAANVDAVILLAGTMVNELGLEGLAALLERTKALPTCAIAVQVPGVPSVVVDNETGIHQAMRHLVEHHGCRRIAFVRGPRKNKEAEARFLAYRAALEKSSLAFDEQLVCEGDFLRHSGEDAVQRLWALETPPEAVICANDETAIGALGGLVKAGVRVPEDARVLGFDGVDAARLSNPPLTTVRQPLIDLAVTAVRTVMDQIQGREVQELQTLGTHLVVRESCGCVVQLTSTGQSQFAEEHSVPPPGARTSSSPLPEDFSEAFRRFRQPLQAELARVARGEFTSLKDWDGRLISGFDAQVRGASQDFVQTLGQFVIRVTDSGGDPNRFQDVITAFRRFALPCCGEDHKLRTHVENVLQEARLVATHAAERVHGWRQIEAQQFAITWSSVGAALTGSFALDELARQICQELPRLGITACYVASYTRQGSVHRLPDQSRLVAAFDQTQGLTVSSPEAEAFQSGELLPRGLLTQRTQRMTVLPLFFRDVDLGYCLLEWRGGNGAVIEGIREQLSIALYACRALQGTSG